MKALKTIPVALNILDDSHDSQVKQMKELHVHLEARLVKIHALTGMLKVAEADRAAGKREIEGLKIVLTERAADINSLHANINSLNAEHAKCLADIDSLNAEHARCLAETDRLTEDVDKLTEWLKDSQQQFSELRSRFPVRVMKKLKLI